MWDRLRRQVTLERQQLRRLLDVHRPLLDKCAASPPNDIELSALASMLHSFYNGVEKSLSALPQSWTVVRLAASSGTGSYWIP